MHPATDACNLVTQNLLSRSDYAAGGIECVTNHVKTCSVPDEIWIVHSVKKIGRLLPCLLERLVSITLQWLKQFVGSGA
jgi:hypothetical protein